LGRLTGADYSTGESFGYEYDAAGNRKVFTSTTPLSGTLVTTYQYDDANRLTSRSVSDGRSYTYTWSQRGQLLAETIQGVDVRTFTYDGAGRLVEATVFTLTTKLTYNGLGARVAVEIVGYGTTTVTLDYAGGNAILAETTITGTTLYLYGADCLGELRDDEWLYYQHDGDRMVRQGTDAEGEVVSAWLFDPDGTMLEGPDGPVSHLICGGVYDWSTGLIYRGGRYFDPTLGIWLALVPLVVVQSWRRRKKKGLRGPWAIALALFLVGTSGMLTGCVPPGGLPATCPTPVDVPTGTPMPTSPPTSTPTATLTPTSTPAPPTETPTPTPLPLPPSYVFGVQASFDNGITIRRSGKGAGVAVDTNAILSHHHHTGRGFKAAHLVSVEIFDASGNRIHLAETSKGEVAMLADADMDWSMTLIVFKHDIWAGRGTALLGDADGLKKGDSVLQSVSRGAPPGLYPTTVDNPDFSRRDGDKNQDYRALSVSSDRTRSGDSGSPLYDETGQVVYGVNNSGAGVYGAIREIGRTRAQIATLTQALRGNP
jgi:YD repeat-containing protein